ncbi:MAG: hypothetical protein IJS82_04225 [Paludibacteraceae bacterium]|nr:hypothetical protein [Paludibacteraceae bacterium]
MLTAILLSLVMTFTVETKSSVKAEGTIPSNDFDATYACTFQKGSVREGDTATLQLRGLGGIQIDSIVLYLKSNKSAGSGEIRVVTDGREVAKLSGSYWDWYGAYSTAYRPLTVFRHGTHSVEELTIELVGTVNSLYIEQYEIVYQAPPAYSVQLKIGDETIEVLTEANSHAGVLLPSLPDRDSLSFVGWSETEFGAITAPPALWLADERFYPTADMCLWSVWHYGEKEDTNLVAELETGSYLYVNSHANVALTGVPYDGKMDIDLIDTSNPDQVYWITFLSPDTATIQHVQTGTFIGWQGKSLAAKESPWLVYHEGAETIFYMRSGADTYVLWPNILDTYGELYAGLLKATPANSPLGLRKPRPTDGKEWFTCHPEVPMAVEEVLFNGNERIVRFGIYELHIKEGKKYLRIKN